MQNNATNLREYESDDLESGHSLLYGQYEIERHLIDGGFGMTYLARDSLDRRVVIKECFPSAVCRRINGEVRPRKETYQEQYQNVIRCFLREALRMAKFDHPNIVKVHQVFQENNTAYIAMDYVDGMDLLTMLDMDPGRLSDEMVESLLRDTLNALQYVHDLGMLHRDISPDNLLLDAQNKLTLIDFGAAREDATRQTRALSTVMSVKDGYSPHEFYYTDGVQTPSSDIYSVGATFYHLITGFAPPNCQKRVAALSSDSPDPYKPLASGNWAFSAHFLEAIDKALLINQKHRFQSAEEWLQHLDAPADKDDAPDEPAAAEPQDTATEPKPDPKTQTEAVADTAVEVELDPKLEAKISTLVEDTNCDVEAVDPLKIREEKLAASQVEEEAPPLVDIFGEPIEDLEKWLKEQDKQAKRKRTPDAKGKSTGADEQTDAAPAESSGSVLFRAFNKLTKIRSRSVAVAQN